MQMVVDRDSVKRILVIKLRAVGDVLLSTVVTGNLRAAFPEAEIDFLAEHPASGVLKGNTHLDTIIVFDRKIMTGPELIRTIRNYSYDLVIDLFGNPRTALVTRLSGARYRVGYRFRGRTYAYNIVVEPRGDRVHNTQFNLDALEAIGVPIVDRSVNFPLSPADAQFVDAYLGGIAKPGAFLVGLNTGGGWHTKRWGLDRFASLADRLAEEYGAEIILPWGPGELRDAERIRETMKHTAHVPPATTLSQLGALLKQCTIVVSNDSGPMHIAAAVGTPVLAIFGPTNPVLQGPVGDKHLIVRQEELECLGCNLTACPIDHPCMLQLSVDHVLTRVGMLLGKNGITLPKKGRYS